MKKMCFSVGLYGLLSLGIYAQNGISITDEKYSSNKCTPGLGFDKNVRLDENSLYLSRGKETPKGSYDIKVVSNETCVEEGKSQNVKMFWDGASSVSFIASPKKQMALGIEYSMPNYGVPKFMGTHAINQKGEVVWSEEWDLKSGDTELDMISANIDDEGNALFFVKAKQKEGIAHAIVYRNLETGKYKVIPYELDVNGRVTFRANFDEWGHIHFMGAFSRTDTKQTGETKRGVFHGKVDPKSEGTLKTTLYAFEEVGRYDSDWKLKDYYMDDEGNITLCMLGQYAKSGAGRDFSKLFILQLDNEGKEKWSHLISTVNLMREPMLGEGTFRKLGNNYAYLYFDNEEYIKYVDGFNATEVNSEPKLNELQMYLIDAGGNLTKHAVAPMSMFSKYTGSSYEQTEDALYVIGKDSDKKISW